MAFGYRPSASQPSMRAGVTPGMGADEVRFTQAKNVQQYQNDQRGTQNHAAGINYGMSNQEARATQAKSVQQASGGMAAYTPPGSQGGYAAYTPPTSQPKTLEMRPWTSEGIRAYDDPSNPRRPQNPATPSPPAPPSPPRPAPAAPNIPGGPSTDSPNWADRTPQPTDWTPGRPRDDRQYAGGTPGDWRNVGNPPTGARSNDLSGQVPANQVYAQAYNQASEQVGSPNRATSYTMPGTRTSRSLNPATGQYSEPQTQQSFDGNMAYNAIDNRPGPIQSRATGIDGSAMPWQDALSQREAFTGGLVERLGQYQSGAQTGRPDINPGQLLNQANERLADGSFSNPFSQAAVSQRAPQSPQSAGNFSQPVAYGDSTFQGYGAGQNPDVQRAMGNANQYMQGNFQNPFGDSQQANNPMPSWDQPSYDPQPPRVAANGPGAAQPTPPQRPAGPWTSEGIRAYDDPRNPTRPTQATPQSPSAGAVSPGAAQPRPEQSQGTPYNPSAPRQQLPPAPDPIQSELNNKKKAAEYRAQNNITTPRAAGAPKQPAKRSFTDMVPFADYDPVTGQIFTQDTPAQLAEKRMMEQEQKAQNDLYDNGTDTPENAAAMKAYFQVQRWAKANPGKAPPASLTNAVYPGQGKAPNKGKAQPARRGTAPRQSYAWR